MTHGSYTTYISCITQVPQFVLEDAAARGVTCNIIVAQPRRVSAMSVAERVAAERGLYTHIHAHMHSCMHTYINAYLYTFIIHT